MEILAILTLTVKLRKMSEGTHQWYSTYDNAKWLWAARAKNNLSVKTQNLNTIKPSSLNSILMYLAHFQNQQMTVLPMHLDSMRDMLSLMNRTI